LGNTIFNTELLFVSAVEKKAAQGPVSAGVGDRPGSPGGAVGFWLLLFVRTSGGDPLAHVVCVSVGPLGAAS
jgi:hypothetical protein